MKPVIALDADGVLLDYHTAVIKLMKELGQEPELDLPCYDLNNQIKNCPPKGHEFWKLFREKGWEIMDPLPGAQAACHWLHDNGFKLVCVSALPPKNADNRLKNLRKLGLPIEKVYATGTSRGDVFVNPKKNIISSIGASVFVDDDYRYLSDVKSCQRVLIDRGFHDSPNKKFDIHRTVNVHSSLYEWTSFLRMSMHTEKCIERKSKIKVKLK